MYENSNSVNNITPNLNNFFNIFMISPTIV